MRNQSNTHSVFKLKSVDAVIYILVVSTWHTPQNRNRYRKKEKIKIHTRFKAYIKGHASDINDDYDRVVPVMAK